MECESRELPCDVGWICLLQGQPKAADHPNNSKAINTLKQLDSLRVIWYTLWTVLASRPVGQSLRWILTTMSRCALLLVVAQQCRRPGGCGVVVRLLSLSLVTFTDPSMPPQSSSQSIRRDHDCNDKLVGRKVAVFYNCIGCHDTNVVHLFFQDLCLIAIGLPLSPGHDLSLAPHLASQTAFFSILSLAARHVLNPVEMFF